MRLLQRYILFDLLRVFAFLLSALTILLVFVGLFQQTQESGLGAAQVLQILPFVVPSLLPFTIPATLLLAVCVVYGRVAGNQEVTAAKAAGVNVLSLLWPAFLLGAVLSVCSLLLTDQVIPWAMANIRQTVTMALEDIFLDRLRTQHEVTDYDRGFSVTVDEVRGKKLIRPTFLYAPGGRSPVTLQAREATIEFDIEQKEVVLNLVQGYIDIPGDKRVEFQQETRPFPLLGNNEKTKPRHLSVRRIRRELKSLKSLLHRTEEKQDVETSIALLQGRFGKLVEPEFLEYPRTLNYHRIDLAKMRTEMHSRFAMAASCFFFVLVGGPFAIVQGRRQFLTSFFMCFVPILLIYYPVVLLAMNLSKTETVNPAWAMWSGNLLLLCAAAVVLRKVLKH